HLVVQEAIGVDVRAVEDHLGRRAPLLDPVLAELTEVAAADAARGDDDLLASGAEGAAVGPALAGQRDGAPALDLDVGDLVIEQQRKIAAARVRLERVEHAEDDLVAGAPGDVPARDAVARAKDAALRPIYDRQELDLLLVEEVEDVFARILAVELGPAAW